MSKCTYCGSGLSTYDPVWVSEGSGDDRSPVGGFCNYACLHEHVESEELAYGSACAWPPDAA